MSAGGGGRRAKKRRRRRRGAITGLGVGGTPASVAWGNDYTTEAVCAAAAAAACSALHPGTGNYTHEPWMRALVREPLGNDRLRWPAFERAASMKGSVAASATRCTPEAFEAVAATLEPCLRLPRRVLRGQWRGPDGPKIRALPELWAEAGQAPTAVGQRFRGRPYTQTPRDRLHSFWMTCRRPGAMASQVEQASCSAATIGLDLDAVSG